MPGTATQGRKQETSLDSLQLLIPPLTQLRPALTEEKGLQAGIFGCRGPETEQGRTGFADLLS